MATKPTIAEYSLQNGLHFMEAKNYRKGRRAKVRVLVIHTAETPEKDGMARGIMSYNQRRTDKVSCHEAVDNKEAVAGVRPWDTAWTTGTINDYAYSWELAGRASQDKTDWADPYSTEMLAILAKRVAKAAVCWNIPVVKLTAEDLKAGKKAGICGHLDATLAFQPGGHWDPGYNFPWKAFLAQVQVEVDAIKAGSGSPSNSAPKPVEAPKDQPAPKKAKKATPAPQPAGKTHEVGPGETYWQLAKRYLGSGSRWHELAKANGSRPLHPGDVIRIPEA